MVISMLIFPDVTSSSDACMCVCVCVHVYVAMNTCHLDLFRAHDQLIPSDKVVLMVKSLSRFGGFGLKVISTIFP